MSERSESAAAESPLVVSIVGRKNSGKTTVLVALAAELRRRGHRVASLKHGHPHFEVDRPGSDSWRHFHEGGAAAVVLASSAKVVLIERQTGEPDPRELVSRLLGGRGYAIVLVEGYKRGPFPKIEVFRRAAGHDAPLCSAAEAGDDAGVLAVVTDDPGLDVGCEVVPIAEAADARSADGRETEHGRRPAWDAPAGGAAAEAARAGDAPAHILRLANLLEARAAAVKQ